MAGFWGPEIIEQVKAANDIVDVVGSYLPLKRAGSQFKCLTPFKKERTPSFFVNPAKQIWHCFSTNQGGDVIKFVQTYENLDFPAAVRLLAERAGIKLPEGRYEGGSGDEGAGLKDQLLDLMERVAQWWHRSLFKDPVGEPARSYLKGRGITAETAREFRLGYAPDGWDSVIRWAEGAGFAEEALEAAGLVIRSERGGPRPIYDRFRGRLMFPIQSESGRVIAFSGRVLDPMAKEAKYINSPETILFTKGKVLYGLHLHKRELLDTRQAIVCEGQLDLITCHQAGVRNMVAPQGTAFTEHQARVLKRYADEVVLCFDSDEAGQTAMARSIPALAGAELPVRVLRLPDEADGSKNDPDSFIRAHSVERFRELAERAVDFWDHFLDHLSAKWDPRTDRGRMVIRREIFDLLAHVADAARRQQILARAAGVLRMDATLLMGEFGRHSRVPRTARPTPDDGAKEAVREAWVKPHRLVESLLHLSLHRPDAIPSIQRRLDPVWLERLDGAALLNAVFEAHSHHALEDPAAGVEGFGESERGFLSGLLARQAPQGDAEALISGALTQIERLWIDGQLERRRALLNEGPAADRATELHREILDLRAKLDHLNRLTSSLNPPT
ncbi:MAG TPA: DNA primase [Verrucomicrobiae bacterium]|nr:DNA primase [Verrucomicrobiae bacterium]